MNSCGVHTRIAGLYAVTPDLADTADLCRRVCAVLDGGARVLQYRNKTAGPELRLEQAHALQRLCQSREVALIINDHLELALQTGAAGLHLGGDDGDLAAARAALGPDRLLGEAKHRLRAPVVAIGGITAANAKSLIDAGADAVAVISAVFAAPDVEAAARDIQSLFEPHRG